MALAVIKQPKVTTRQTAAASKPLSPKQKKLDINKDGKIGSDDLKKVRQGKTAEKSAVGQVSPERLFLKTGSGAVEFSRDDDQVTIQVTGNKGRYRLDHNELKTFQKWLKG